MYWENYELKLGTDPQYMIKFVVEEINIFQVANENIKLKKIETTIQLRLVGALFNES